MDTKTPINKIDNSKKIENNKTYESFPAYKESERKFHYLFLHNQKIRVFDDYEPTASKNSGPK